jgi:hypothetical protein
MCYRKKAPTGVLKNRLGLPGHFGIIVFVGLSQQILSEVARNHCSRYSVGIHRMFPMVKMETR